MDNVATVVVVVGVRYRGGILDRGGYTRGGVWSRHGGGYFSDMERTQGRRVTRSDEMVEGCVDGRIEECWAGKKFDCCQGEVFVVAISAASGNRKKCVTRGLTHTFRVGVATFFFPFFLATRISVRRGQPASRWDGVCVRVSPVREGAVALDRAFWGVCVCGFYKEAITQKSTPWTQQETPRGTSRTVVQVAISAVV